MAVGVHAILFTLVTVGCNDVISCPGRPPSVRPAPAGEAGTKKAPDLRRFQFVQPKWGTGFKIILYAPDEQTARRASDSAFARVDEMGKALSDYDPESELSKLFLGTQNGPMAAPVQVSEDLYRVLEQSVEAARRSDGAFDVTVGPYTRLWRRSHSLGELPTPERLEETRKSVGIQHLRLDPKNRTAQLLAPKMRIDLGGIATGYATDEVLNVLRKHGVTRALIDAGGDVAASEPPPLAAGWTVAIQLLESPEKMAGANVLLRNAAVSTSGDTYRYVEIDGKRYSHIVDPRTGLGLTRRVGATVVAPDGMTADWLDTAIPVMGPEKGMKLVESIPGAAARITVLEDDGIKVYESKRFRPLLVGAGRAASESP